MINNKKVLALIPARGGSKGVPRKALVELGGKSLLRWTVEAAQACSSIDHLVLSTDDEEYANVARSLGCDVPFLREAHLATDSASGMDVVLDAIERLPGYDLILLLQPTSPLRKAADIQSFLEFSQSGGSDFCVSVSRAEKSPFWMFTAEDDKLQPIMDKAYLKKGRQDLPDIYVPNGALYLAPCSGLKKQQSFFTDETLGYKMPKESSVDIDNPEDLLVAQYFLDNH